MDLTLTRLSYPLFAFEEMLKILHGEVITMGEADEEEIDFWSGGHLLKHGDEFVAIDSAAIRRRFHRVEFLCHNTRNNKTDGNNSS